VGLWPEPAALNTSIPTSSPASCVRHHSVPVDELSALIATVHQSLGRAGQAPPVAGAPVPAVPVRRSVHPDYVVCLECGFRSRTLRRHLRVRHGLEVAAYRVRWNLSPDHALVAPAYSARRSAMAKQLGLGRRPAPVEEPPAPKRRGRPRRPAAP
jgi:predicted transcriptional regulator